MNNFLTEKKRIIFVLIVGLGFSGFYIFSSWYSMSEYGSDLLYQKGEFFLGMLAILSLMLVFAILGCFITLALPKHRLKASASLKYLSKICGIFVFSIILALGVGEFIRDSGFRAITARSQLLIDAIQHYQTAHSTPPNTLNDLVPKYISDIPTTKMNAYPEFNFVRNHDPIMYGGNPWLLVVPISANEDTCKFLIYYPNHNYPISGQGNIHDGKFEDWALIWLVNDDARRNGFIVKDQ